MFNKPTVVLIDADSMAYMVCVTNQGEDDFSVHKTKIKGWVDTICERSGASKYCLFLTMGKSFRSDLYSSYKAKRKYTHVKFLSDLKQWMIEEEGAVYVDKLEADDLLSIYGNVLEKNEFNVVLSYIDKDLKQLKWNNYNYTKGEFNLWDESSAFDFYLEQLIVGDSVDNVSGIPGKGPAYVEKNKDTIVTIQDVMIHYISHYKSYTEGINEFNKSIQLLTLLDTPKDGMVLPEYSTILRDFTIE